MKTFSGSAYRKALKIFAIATIGFIVCFAVASVVAGPPAKWYLHYFCFEMRGKVDAESIRKWSSNTPPGARPELVPAANWPPAILKLSPIAVVLESGNVVMLNYSKSGFVQWGLIIGPEGMAVPQLGSDYIVLPYENGSYVYIH